MLLLIGGLLAFVLLFRVPSASHRFVWKLLDAGHIPLFGLVSLAFLRIVKQTDRPPGRAVYPYLAAWLLTVLAGAGVEGFQAFLPGRHVEIGDVLHNALGAAGFLAIACVHAHREVPAGIRLAVTTGACLLMAGAFVPAALATLDAFHMVRDFPVIASFERVGELSRWGALDAATSPSRRHTTDGTRSLEVRLRPGPYPGIGTRDLVRDWRGYDRLQFDAYLEGDHPLGLTVRVDDAVHDDRLEDRYNGRFTLRPGSNHVEIPLEDLRRAPAGREMDLETIVFLCIFSDALREPRTFTLDNIRLR